MSPIRCQKVEPRSCKCLLCRKDTIGRFYDYDFDARACHECAPFLIEAQAELGRANIVPPPDGHEPRPITITA